MIWRNNCHKFNLQKNLQYPYNATAGIWKETANKFYNVLEFPFESDLWKANVYKHCKFPIPSSDFFENCFSIFSSETKYFFFDILGMRLQIFYQNHWYSSSHFRANVRDLSFVYKIRDSGQLYFDKIDSIWIKSKFNWQFLFITRVVFSKCEIIPSNQLLAFSHFPLVVKSPGKHTVIWTFVTIGWKIMIRCKVVKIVLFAQWLFNLKEWNPAVHF